MSKDQAVSSCAIQSKLRTLLRNSIAQDKSVADKQPGTRVELQRKKRESITLPRIENSIGPGITKTAMKGGASNSTLIQEDSNTHTSITHDAITWTSTWEMMKRTLEAIVTKNTDLSDRGGGKSRKRPSKNRRNSKTIQMVAIIPGLR